MSNDRSVHTDALETLGTIIDDTQKRDAIHLAVVPMLAASLLFPGAHVNADGVNVGRDFSVGIVDPFLPRAVAPGERFWCVIYPRKITSLRHVWSHPAFSEEVVGPASTNSSLEWLRTFAESYDITYNRLMTGAADWVESKKEVGGWGVYLVGGAEMEGAGVPDEFWTHYEAVTGNIVAEEHRGSFFSCSC